MSHHQIFKYPLDVLPRQVVMMHESADPLALAEQGGLLVLYARVRHPQPGPAAPRVFQIVTTGDVFDAVGKKFIDHITLGSWFEAFVFEVVVPQTNDPVDDRHSEDFEQLRREREFARRLDERPFGDIVRA